MEVVGVGQEGVGRVGTAATAPSPSAFCSASLDDVENTAAGRGAGEEEAGRPPCEGGRAARAPEGRHWLTQKEEELRERKLIKYSHVNSKLEEKTTAMKEKERGKYDGTNPKEANTFGGIIGTGVGRAVPSWRQGL